MYFPYFRGKQYELLALRELINQKILIKKIIPIIEPVKENFSNLNTAISSFIDNKSPFVLIINPQYGDLINNSLKIKNDFIKKYLEENNSGYYLGYIINDRTRDIDLDNFLAAYSENQIFLIHYARFQKANELNSILNGHKNVKYNALIENSVGRQYKEKIRAGSAKFVLIEDNFARKKNNADFGEADFFSVLYKRYLTEGFVGFGDFLLIGDDYSDTGGPAYAVAIHLSEETPDNEIWIRHFISDSNGTPVDPGGKFFEALKKLIRYLDANPARFDFSNACHEFRSLYKQKHFPGLGYVKKLSMKHHIELMSKII